MKRFYLTSQYIGNCMKKLITLCLLISTIGFAQSEQEVGRWETNGVIGVALNQVSLSDWTQGGENLIAYTLFNKINANYVDTPWTLKNELKISFGQTKSGSGSLKINDNEFFLENVLVYKSGWVVNPYFSNTVQTVLASGYDYGTDPAVQISAFFDPAYITQSIGMEYSYQKYFSTRLGIGLQEVFTNTFTHFTDDPDTKEIEKFKLKTGVESVTAAELPVMENVTFITKLRLFSQFTELDVWDVRWDNTIAAKVNKFLTVNLNVLLVHQIDQSRKTQWKQALQIGFVFPLF